jgi:hypothetical protein
MIDSTSWRFVMPHSLLGFFLLFYACVPASNNPADRTGLFKIGALTNRSATQGPVFRACCSRTGNSVRVDIGSNMELGEA